MPRWLKITLFLLVFGTLFYITHFHYELRPSDIRDNRLVIRILGATLLYFPLCHRSGRIFTNIRAVTRSRTRIRRVARCPLYHHRRDCCRDDRVRDGALFRSIGHQCRPLSMVRETVHSNGTSWLFICICPPAHPARQFRLTQLCRRNLTCSLPCLRTGDRARHDSRYVRLQLPRGEPRLRQYHYDLHRRARLRRLDCRDVYLPGTGEKVVRPKLKNRFSYLTKRHLNTQSLFL